MTDSEFFDTGIKIYIKEMVMASFVSAKGLIPSGWSRQQLVDSLAHEVSFFNALSNTEAQQFKEFLLSERGLEPLYKVYQNLVQGALPIPADFDFLDDFEIEDRPHRAIKKAGIYNFIDISQAK